MKEIVINMKEIERISILDKLIEKRIKQRHAALQLGISIRQVRRLVKRYKRDGVSGLTHKSRGRTGNRALPLERKEQIALLLKTQYSDFGPTLAAEKLGELDKIFVSKETVRKLLIQEQLWKAQEKKHVNIHTYRDRRSCTGELIQLDGSPHPWFENRADPCTLIAYIDDATSKIMDGEFADYDST